MLRDRQRRSNGFPAVIHASLIEVEFTDLETSQAKRKLVRHADPFLRESDVLFLGDVLELFGPSFSRGSGGVRNGWRMSMIVDRAHSWVDDMLPGARLAVVRMAGFRIAMVSDSVVTTAKHRSPKSRPSRACCSADPCRHR